MPSFNLKNSSIFLTKLQKCSIVNDCKDEFTTASNPMIITDRIEWNGKWKTTFLLSKVLGIVTDIEHVNRIRLLNIVIK